MIAESQLKAQHARLQPVHGGVWQDCFAVQYLMNEFGLSESEAATQVAFGGHDYGFDAFHVAPDLRNLYLFQFKWTSDHRQFAQSIKRLSSAGFARVFGARDQDLAQNALLDELRSTLYEKRAVVDRVFIHCVFRGNAESAEASQHLDSLREDLESQRFLLDAFFGRDVEFVFEYRSIEGRRRAGRTVVPATFEFPISLTEVTTPPRSPDGHQLVVGFVPLLELHGFYRAMRHRLFDRNIRFGLSQENMPNREIRRSLEAILQGVEPPEHFAFFHNGVSLAARALRREGDGWRIVEPRVLNGAQTISSVEHFLEAHNRDPILKAHEGRLRRIHVLTKLVLVSAGSDAFVTRVTMNTNRQNPVAAWNLRANDEIQLSYHDAFAEQLKIPYERQQGWFESMADDDLDARGIDPSQKPIQLKKLTKTLLALQGEVKWMSQWGEVFENDRVYQNTFRQEYIDRDLRDVVVAYKVGECTARMAQHIHDRGENKYWFIKRGTNLLWALGVQALFNQYDREELAECYGSNTRLPAKFRETMNDLASKRLRFIIDAVISDTHRDDLSEGRYSFLHTKAFFDACMQHAKREHRWTSGTVRSRR